ncbi:ABC transporter permease [[Clostridium] polysaccharolyticum]|uniref:Putative ABC transport system permease protein n=1 Tax=[Clostridium] polysaccharolyticum TaxID=29364 RepID=A0A1I0BAE9_9FIRM|nr:ABC transporter permease [[Clostridium] polysaccharolyticum]SET03784.1 putative ABC transport system permease protein [[Clostridium] polysaccharolyticum]
MLSRISFKNIRKSYKDYTIYFITLILGVAIFYLFNSIDSQQAMFVMSKRSEEIIKLLVTLLSGVSVGVSVILGFLIIYANGFLVRKRKKEFGIYMTLGMSKQNISKILLGETLIIGSISLIAGLIAGIFASQFMSILIGKLFEADMKQFQFVFSKEAAIKTIVYFGIMFACVIAFNIFAIGRFKLVDLLNASKKNQVVRVKNPVTCVLVFVIGAGILSYCYYHVTCGLKFLTGPVILLVIALGSISTYLVFWSLSGFFLMVLQKSRKIYYRGLNAFILRQIHNKINTMVLAMTIICLLLFVSICAISSGISLRESINQEIRDAAPADISIDSLNDAKGYKEIEKRISSAGFPIEELKEWVEIPCYRTDELKQYEDILGKEVASKLKKDFPVVGKQDVKENIYLLSDYNKLAKLYGNETFSLEEDEYIAVCTLETLKNYQNLALKSGQTIQINGKTFHSRYSNCQKGILTMGSANATIDTIILPDSAWKENGRLQKTASIFAGNYKANKKEQMEKIENSIRNFIDNKQFDKQFPDLSWETKTAIHESATGIAVIVTFIGLYIGIVFLITSAALLALKELSEAADNKERYMLLCKLGTDEKMVHKALFWQIAIFFFLPISLAIIHSIFGIGFVNRVVVMLKNVSLLKPIFISSSVFGVIYILYFLFTFISSKRILED